MPRLSVVVPVYNVEEYLDDCLMSLDEQDYRDFEAICVNDGSTDGSRAILERWGGVKPWVKVVDKENGGLSSARNAGIRAATGDYVCFLDSDDRLTPDACGRIVTAFEESRADVVVYGGYALPREATWPWLEYALTPGDVTYEGYSDELVFGEQTRPFAWRTAATRAFLLGSRGEAVLFDEAVRYGEDQPFQFIAYALSERTKVMSDRLYEYRVNRVGSLMSTARMDDCTLLLEHVRIMEGVIESYVRLGVLDRAESGMLRWLARFIALDALLLEEGECERVMDSLADLLETRWTAEDISAADLSDPVREVLLMSYGRRRVGALGRRLLVVRLRNALFGDGSLLSRAARKLSRVAGLS